MLMRQLQRPLTRSLAAAWRPAPYTVPVTASAQRLFSTSQSQWISTEPKEDGASSPAAPSLFAELFPDEAKQRARLHSAIQSQSQAQSSASLDTKEDQPLTKPPPRTLSPLPQSAHPLISYYEDSSHHPAAANIERCTVVLNAASKQLTQSDFYRVGAGRAAHVEGWVGGITKVIQARDPDTLEPLGRYYISFETAAAADSWREEVKRLWQLSRVYTPGVVRHKVTPGTADFAVGRPASAKGSKDWMSGSIEATESIRREVDGFTLVPPSMRWDLEMAKYTAEERAMEHAGSLVEKLCRKAGTRFLVMVAVGGGRISPETLRTAIRDDGKQRRLPWRVKNLEARVGDGTWGIMPFGKSGLKAQDQVQESVEENREEQEDKATRLEQQGAGSADMITAEARRYPRFLVPFLDEAEARRFVRNWHRREVTLKMGHEDADPKNLKEWDETRIFNVTLLW